MFERFEPAARQAFADARQEAKVLMSDNPTSLKYEQEWGYADAIINPTHWPHWRRDSHKTASPNAGQPMSGIERPAHKRAVRTRHFDPIANRVVGVGGYPGERGL